MAGPWWGSVAVPKHGIWQRERNVSGVGSNNVVKSLVELLKSFGALRSANHGVCAWY